MAKLNRRQILEKIYDELYSQAEQILKVNNPCESCILSNGQHTCLGKRDFSATKGSYNDNTTESACCIGCQYWKAGEGCKAEKPLFCKVWLCGTAGTKHFLVRRQLEEIKRKTSPFFFCCFSTCRKDKTESINISLEYLGNTTVKVIEGWARDRQILI